MSDCIKQEFDRKIGRLTKSMAYLDYCEEVYGYRMYLFNMMDREQLDYVFNKLTLSEEDVVVDLGCGAGSILKHVIKEKGCLGIGIDQLSEETVGMHTKMQYLVGDIDHFSQLELQPTVTLLIDSIYFSENMEELIHELSRIDHNRIYIFYSQYIFEEGESQNERLDGEQTDVATCLKHLGLQYDKIDFSFNEKKLYENSLRALEKRRERFIEEGNLDLFEEKQREQLMGKTFYEENRASRFLYIVDGR